MSESSLPSVEDVDLADDVLQDIIKEAESVMLTHSDLPSDATNVNTNTNADQSSNLTPTDEPIDVETSIKTVDTLNFGGNFSIDDDDDDEEHTTTTTSNTTGGGMLHTHNNNNNNNNNDSNDPAAAVITATTAVTPIDTPINDNHPLSADNLYSASLPPTTSASMSTGGISGGMGMMGSSMMTNIQKRVSGNAGEAAAAVNMDTITKTTSMFASNLASMAQRGIAQVAAATAAPSQPSVQHIIGGLGSQQHHHQQQSMIPGQQHQPWSNGMNNNVFSAMTTGTVESVDRGTIGGVSAENNSSNNGMIITQQYDKEQKQRLLQDHVGDLFQGEQVIMFLTNLLHVSDTSGLSYLPSQQQQKKTGMWCACMTYYRLILFSTSGKDNTIIQQQVDPPAGWDRNCWMTATPPNTSIHLLEIPLASMDRVEKTVYQTAGSSFMGLVIHAKDCGRILRFTTTSYADTGRVYECLNTYAFPGRRNLGYLFAFESKRLQVIASIKMNEMTGKQEPTLDPIPRRFNPVTEYPRLIHKTGITQSPWAVWTSINSTYDFSPSYPSVLVGPASLDETKPEAMNVIRQCSAFRSEKRLPSMTWCGAGGSSLWRSSQPKVGLQGNRSPADELFVRHIIESARGANAMAEPPNIYPRSFLEQLTGHYSNGSGKADPWVPELGCGLKILDLRPRSAAMANRTGGYGYENTSNYSNTTLQFCNLQNIHAVRDSYQKLCNVCNDKSTSDVLFNSLVEDTKWLAHVRIILAASWEAAYWVHIWRMPILIHCSHGWDRTSQVSCLAQLFLDPYYRTRQGFSCLVEKDFMSFGHPFHLRCAHGYGRSDIKKNSQSSTTNDGQISPIFLQFLDCVYQLVELYPNAFEFNTAYLLEMSFHVYSCRFGDMLCDSERERELVAQIRQRTYSIWDHLESKIEFINTEYVESEGVMLMPLPTLLRNVKLWSKRHFAFSPKPSSMV